MHGELIEFNERLHRALVAKEALVSQMRQELIDLRGPVSAPALPFCSHCLPTTTAARIFLPGESHGQRSLVGYSPGSCKESDTTEAT